MLPPISGSSLCISFREVGEHVEDRRGGWCRATWRGWGGPSYLGLAATATLARAYRPAYHHDAVFTSASLRAAGTGDIRSGHGVENIQPGRSFTLRAVLAGLVIAVLVCLSNVYFRDPQPIVSHSLRTIPHVFICLAPTFSLSTSPHSYLPTFISSSSPHQNIARTMLLVSYCLMLPCGFLIANDWLSTTDTSCPHRFLHHPASHPTPKEPSSLPPEL
jgi:hypothetical protein